VLFDPKHPVAIAIERQKTMKGLPMSNRDIEMKKSNTSLLAELSQIIEEGKKRLSIQVNSTVTLTYWQVGTTINHHILKNKRAEYAKEIVPTLSTQLKQAYGRSFEERNLRRMMQFASDFVELDIVSPLATQLSWSYFIELLPLKIYPGIGHGLYFCGASKTHYFGWQGFLSRLTVFSPQIETPCGY